MINFFDVDSVESFSNARREQFMQEVERDRIARVLKTRHHAAPGRFRRAVGALLIQAGARLSGDYSLVPRRGGALI